MFFILEAFCSCGGYADTIRYNWFLVYWCCTRYYFNIQFWMEFDTGW